MTIYIKTSGNIQRINIGLLGFINMIMLPQMILSIHIESVWGQGNIYDTDWHQFWYGPLKHVLICKWHINDQYVLWPTTGMINIIDISPGIWNVFTYTTFV